MTGIALECNCILIGSPLNLPVLSWKSACMLSSISALVCPPEITAVAGAGVFFSREM